VCKTARKKFSSLIDPYDLAALETKTSHQTLLIENEGANAAVQRVSG
jgi:hypothetical protein